MTRRLFLFACGVLLGAFGAAAQSPSSDWRTIETDHFRLHFPAPFEPWARRAAAAIEGIHSRVSEFVGFAPKRPIEVLIQDPAADANGLAFPFLDRPEIRLWTSPPEAESGIGFYSDWMELLVTHEVAHIVHMTRPRNRSRGILARLSPVPLGPIAWQAPRWVLEGYATLVEGALTGSGRPRSSYRAMVLRRFAIEGKLPSYGALNSTRGWLGGSMAYLVGSTYLEWLEEREGEGSLQKLWKRMASRRGGGFGVAFRAVFGRSPADLYDRFRAELTARALEQEKRLAASGLVEGDLWQRLEGGTLSPQVSPDGSRILALRSPKRGEDFLAVWTLEESDEERKAQERRREREERLLRDPNEVADRRETPRPRAPRWRLPRVNGHAPSDPRWMPDSRKVLFSRRAPDGEGMLRFDLFLWEPESGRVEPVTHLSDVSAADPSPDGRFAVGVRNRYGLSALVQVDLRTGTVQEIPTRVESSDPWVVWNHPRVSPDGRHIAALLHRGRRWRLVALPREGGEPREVGLPGSPAGPPAWSPDGTRLFVATDASGTWNLASVEVGGGKALELTRVTGGAFSAAPAPDGTSLFFLELTAKGVNLRQMKVGGGLPPVPREAGGYPLLPPPAIESQPREPAEVAPKQRYNLWRSQVVRPIFGYTVGPDGKAWQLGLEGADVVEQLHWTALGSLGDAAGPRGGALAAAYRGLPVALSLHLFSAVEQPGSQRVVHRPEFDQERWGGLLEASWGRSSFGSSQRVSVGAGWTRVDPAAGDDFNRALASLDARVTFRRFRGKSGILLSGALAGSAGRTGGEDWSQVLVTARATGGVGPARLSLSGSLGETAGSPTRFDLFSIGGAGSSLLPAGLDRNRIESPALPHFTQVGEKLERLRAELAGSGLPVLLYGERLRAWDGGAARPDPLEILGAELRADSLLPAELARSIEIYLGVARIKGESPRFRSTRGYAGLIFRP